MRSGRPGGARRARGAQRVLHLASAVTVLAFVYLTPDQGSLLMGVVRWAGFPLLAVSGLAMWQWPRIRRWRRQWRARMSGATA